MKLPVQKILIELFLFGSLCGIVTAQADPDIRPLFVGKSIERELKGGETHSYQISVTADQYLNIVVDQRGIDVMIEFFGANGGKLAEFDSPNGNRGPENVILVTNTSGNYRLDVHSLEKNVASGSYRIEFREQRTVVERDRTYVNAEHIFAEANLLRIKRTPETNRAALEKFLKATQLYQEIDDKSENAGLSLLASGLIALSLGNKSNALKFYEQALIFFESNGYKEHKATTFNNIGFLYFSSGMFDHALEFYFKALKERRQLGDKGGEALVLHNIGGLYNIRGDRKKAIEFFDLVWQIVKQSDNKRDKATILLDIGLIHYELQDYQKALDLYDLAWQIGDQASQASILNRRGSVYAARGEKKKALDYYNQALQLFKNNRDIRGEAGAYGNMGVLYGLTGEPQKALENQNRALSLLESIGNTDDKAKVLIGIGIAYAVQGEQHSALEYYEKALSMAKRVGNKEDEVNALNNIGVVQNAMGEQQKALEFYNLARTQYREIGDKNGEANALMNIGLIYLQLGATQESLNFYGQALKLFQLIGNREGEAATLGNIGQVYDVTGESQRALGYFNNSLVLLREVGDRGGEAKTLNNIGAVYSDLRENQKALEMFNSALPLLRQVGDKQTEGSALANIGFVYSSSGDYKKALDFYHRALPLRRQSGDKSGEATTLSNLMVIWHLMGNQRLAIFYGKQAINIRQNMRSNMKGLDREIQQTYLKSIEYFYRKLAEILINEGRLFEAHQVLNSFKDQQSFDFDRSSEKKNVTLALTAEETDLVFRYEEKGEFLVSAGQKFENLKHEIGSTPDNNEKAKIEQLEVEVKTASSEFLEFLKLAETKFGLTVTAKDKIGETTDTREMQSMLTGLESQTKEKAVVLYTLIGVNNFQVLICTSAGITSVSSPVKGKELSRKVAEFVDRLRQTDSLTKSPIIPQEELKKEGKDLYDIVFAPVALKLEELKIKPGVLMWSLDGALRYLPVGALYDGKKYLAERYGNTVFTRADAGRLQSPVRLKWNGFGFYSSNEYVLPIQEEMRGFPALKNAKDELETIFGTPSIPGIVTGKFIADKEFTQKEFLHRLQSRAPLVHIASHFQLVPGDASSSFLLLGDGSKLTLEDFKNMPDDLFGGVELLTLSACETGLQKERESDGREIDSFAELAQRKGAKAVLASLWKVDDESTLQLMSRFYEMRESKHLTKAEALQRAQLTLIKSKEFSHPYYWAPFILIGNWK